MTDHTLPLLKGTLDLLVLKSLTWDPMHGFGIASWLEQHSEGTLGVDDSAMYQALHRLEGRGYIEAEWGVTETTDVRATTSSPSPGAGTYVLKRRAGSGIPPP